jgi:hypothetical protein
MSFFASVNGLQIVAGTLMVPLVGAWTADLQLATTTPVSGAVQVVIGNLTLQGFVYRSDPYGGQIRARLVGGYGGWRTQIPSQGYGSSSGVKLSTVLNDAARACGEQISIANDSNIGNAYVRVDFDTSVASDVLWQMVTQGFIPAWYVAPSGITQTSAWPTNNVQSAFTVTDQKPDEGIVVIATEDYVSWMPGCTFSAPQLASGQTFTSAGVHYVFDNDGKFRFEVMTSTEAGSDRLLGPIQEIVQKELAPTRFYGRYKYTVSNPSSTTVDGTPVNPSIGLPDVQNVAITADSIASYTPAAGSTCHIMFLDGMPTEPVCVWTDQTPTKASILSGVQPVARLGDQVQCFLPPGLPVVGTVSGNPFTGTITVANPITGAITGGSPVVGTA